MGKNIIRTILLVFFAVLCTSCYGQTIIRVSPNGNDGYDGSTWASAKKTVQAGVDAAYNNGGGEIWVAAGTYNEHITLKANCSLYGGFVGTEDTRSQRNFNINKSILDGSSNGDVVNANGISSAACIDGFTIRNNSNFYGGNFYNGIYCLSASPTIANNTISGNLYGIYSYKSDSIITNNKISGNSNGIYSYQSNSTIISNTIYNNGSIGIYCYYSSSAITNNTITANYQGVSCSSSDSVISHNIVAFNTKGISNNSGVPILSHNCVYGNFTNYSGVNAGSTDISEDPLLENWQYGKLHIQPGS
ncbi:MAG: NosD domain-containing protein, partial [Armatimonadota bacterium]